MSSSTAKPNTPAVDTLEDKLPMPLWELVIMVAGLMALNALAIDIMLPAMSDISAHYNLQRENDQQLVIF
ncbi:MAG: Bcr/CflA family drug resistance efflux transporter, partial [Henriciella sp.]|nr:Bcr/CflA family drug resistance efflux transporter [Henriciella sp.]